VVRDGSGYLQAVVFKPSASETLWNDAERLTQESSLWVVGTVKEDGRAPGGVELGVTELGIVSLCPEYPITPKEHGPDFLLNNRHLWLRSKRQHAVMRVRNEIVFGIRDFFYQRHYVNIDSPILTPAACEGTSTLFSTDPAAAFLQTGQFTSSGGGARQGVLLRRRWASKVEDPPAPHD
jgi:asparaginyl-tRNA synthetase